MHILEAVSTRVFFLTDEELITSRMIAQLYKTVKIPMYHCEEATTSVIKHFLLPKHYDTLLGLMNLHHLLCHLRVNFYVTNFTIRVWET